MAQYKNLEDILENRDEFYTLWDNAWDSADIHPAHYINEVMGLQESYDEDYDEDDEEYDEDYDAVQELIDDPEWLYDNLKDFFFKEEYYKDDLTDNQKENLFLFLTGKLDVPKDSILDTLLEE